MPYIVACKAANGIMIGGVSLKGFAFEREAGKPRPSHIIYGYALTENVPDAAWEEWLAGNRQSPLVLNCIVFGSKDMGEVRSFCYAHRSGRDNMQGARAAG